MQHEKEDHARKQALILSISLPWQLFVTSKRSKIVWLKPNTENQAMTKKRVKTIQAKTK